MLRPHFWYLPNPDAPGAEYIEEEGKSQNKSLKFP
jgi:hypothetical protein